MHSPQDIVLSSFLIMKSVSLVREPEYAYFFFLLATHSLDLFERTTEIPHLDRAIDLLDHFYAVQERGTIPYLMAAVALSSACLQYSLKAEEVQARESALEVLEEARRNPHEVPWISSFGSTRTFFVVGEIIRHRYNVFGPDEDFDKSVHAITSLLNVLPAPSADRQYSALQIAVVSIILILSQTADFEHWLGSLDALSHVIHGEPTSQSLLTEPPPINSNLELTDCLTVLFRAIDDCSVSSGDRVLCLVHMADTLESEDLSSDISQEIGEESKDMFSRWTTEWDAARLFLRNDLRYFETEATSSSGVQQHRFQLFRLEAEVVHRPALANVRFRGSDLVGVHVCTFQFTVIPVDTQHQKAIQDSASTGEFTHLMFFRQLKNMCKPLSSEELEHFISHPEQIDELFARAKHLETKEEPILGWKKSPGVIAYLIWQRQSKVFTNTKQAAQQLLAVNLEKEPGYVHLIYQIAAKLVRHEENIEAVGISSKLFKEFLRVQERGSSKHFLGVMDLASSFTIEFLKRPVQLPLLTAALELFREGVELRGSGPWVFEARKIVVLGRLLRYRLRYFEESDEVLDRTINDFTAIWDLLPHGRPFSASTLEIIVISALLYLAQDWDAEKWSDALRLLRAALELYITGTVPQKTSLGIKNVVVAAQDLLDGGLRVASFSFACEALCVVHTSDVLRSMAFDSCQYPGFLRLSMEMYRRDLQIFAKRKRALSSCWDAEKGGLEKAILAFTNDDPLNSFPSFDPARLSIFRYHAAVMKASNTPRPLNHACNLRYYPTRVSYLPAVQNDSPPSSPAESLSDFSLPPWPDDFMFLPYETTQAENIQSMPSTLIPGIEKIIHDENHEVFKMPLEPRTIRALMRNIDHTIRDIEATLSNSSEKLIRQWAEDVYWDPKDVQLNTRIDKLKVKTPFLAQIGPLQALLSRGPERCLELVESSRALFWTRLLRLQTSFEGLPDELAHRLETVTYELEECKSQTVVSASKEEMKKQFELEGIFAHLLAQARKLPGFENFLKPKTYEMLMEASVGGPIVILLGNNSIYAALIVRPSGVHSVFLKDLTDEGLEKMVAGLNKASKTARGVILETQETEEPLDLDADLEKYDRAMQKAKAASYETILERSWKLIVKPIFELMGFLSSDSKLKDKRPRLWWCPTGKFAFLPIHAAGSSLKSDNAENVSKYVVSSYIPTLSALISARRSKDVRSPTTRHISDLKTLVLAQPTTKGQANLPMTAKELELIEGLVPSDLLIHIANEEGKLSRSNANRTVEEAVTHLTDASILHLACHGHQDRADPLNSGFELKDGRLTLSKMISCRTPNAFLAFLSACESASNDLEIPDESLNLSAAMLYAGETMNDNDGPEVARSIYEELFKHPYQVLDPDVVPYALDAAVQKLQKKGVHPSRWATYIHVGI
ncbi:CHAT domain-containing protein [Flammula alnicola]|nr:CHAT domain-containing protein [Flammula alnicola]